MAVSSDYLVTSGLRKEQKQIVVSIINPEVYKKSLLTAIFLQSTTSEFKDVLGDRSKKTQLLQYMLPLTPQNKMHGKIVW
jgi:hypothetical protein